MLHEQRIVVKRLLVAFAEGRALPSYETYGRTPHGKKKYLITQVSSIEDHSPSGPSVSFIAIDATEWRRAEMARRSGEERFHRLVELIPDAVVIHEDGTLRYTNVAGLELFGANSLEEVVDRTILDFVDPSFHEAVIRKPE